MAPARSSVCGEPNLRSFGLSCSTIGSWTAACRTGKPNAAASCSHQPICGKPGMAPCLRTAYVGTLYLEPRVLRLRNRLMHQWLLHSGLFICDQLRIVANGDVSQDGFSVFHRALYQGIAFAGEVDELVCHFKRILIILRNVIHRFQ